ncbi:MAG: insulinase family protein [Deltaproteobacteria bacterium]|nr:insulinase family protein [Deltaproteobacteria bacterium]
MTGPPRVLVLALLVATGCSGGRAPAAPAPSGLPPALQWPGPELTHFTTAHGLMVARLARDADESRFALLLALPAGSLHETAATRGAAAVLALLLEEGSAWVPAADGGPLALAGGEEAGRWLDEHGVTLRSSAWPEQVVLEARGPAAHARDALRVACATAFRPAWNDDDVRLALDRAADLDAERAQGTPGLAEDVLLSRVFPGHALALPPVPAPDDLPPPDALRAFHRAAARSAGALLVISAPDTSWLAAAVAECRPAADVQAAHLPPAPAPARGDSRAAVVGVTADVGDTVYLRLGGRAPPPGSAPAAALGAVLETLANGFSSTLVAELRTRRGLVYGVEAGLLPARLGAAWYLGTSASARDAAQVLRSARRALAAAAAGQVSADAFRRAARANALAHAAGVDGVSDLAAAVLDEFRLGLHPGESWRTPALLWAMDPAEGVAHAGAFLDPARTVVVVVARPGVLEQVLAGETFEPVAAQDWPPAGMR